MTIVDVQIAPKHDTTVPTECKAREGAESQPTMQGPKQGCPYGEMCSYPGCYCDV